MQNRGPVPDEDERDEGKDTDMRTKTVASLLLAVALGSATAAAGAVEAQAKADPPERVVQGSNAFAFDLYARLAEEEGNRFFSPASIHTALAMTYAGAREQTAEQMAGTLHYPLAPAALPEAYAQLLETLNDVPTRPVVRRERGQMVREKKPVYELVVANALWPQEGYPFRDAYVRTVEEQFGATLRHVDFNEPDQAAATINKWVGEKTREKIQDLVPPSALRGPIRLVLTNAVYFKSNWAETFSKRATKDAPFHVSPDRTADVAMMHQETRFGYGETDQVQLLRLPYKGHALSMLVVLPKKRDGLADVEKKLSTETFQAWRQALQRAKVKVRLPKWEFSDRCSLSRLLKKMGMSLAFDPERADFSGMTTAERLFISSILHKAYVAVDEEGTEAAAATAVMMLGAAMPEPEEPKVFRADHPFLFAITHEETGEILFLGQVADPTKQ